VNAYTSKKETVYYTKSTKESLTECVDILSDMYFHSIFEGKEMAREKKVITEEIAMYHDNPAAVADELSSSTFYAGTPLEHDVAGTKTSVRNLTKEQVEKYMKEHYIPENVVLSFAGNINMKEAEALAENYFENRFTKKGTPKLIKTPEVLTLPKTKFVRKFKDNEQAQIVISYPGINVYDTRYYVLTLLDCIWGNGMSSRLFQTIREKLGLVYSIYSASESSNYGGTLSIYLGTSVKNIKVAVSALKKAIDTILEEGVTQQELMDAKTNLINHLKLRYENTAYVSLYNAKMVSLFNYSIEKEKAIHLLEIVKKEEINELIEDIYGKDNYIICMVGKDMETDLLKEFQSVK
jgi:predicted Zn-dependent peptidase